MSTLPATQQGIPSEHEMMVYHTMAEQAVESKMYRGIGDKAGVMMIMLASRELGIPPMQALNGGLHIINGKVEISARMMNALIRKEGHVIQVVECNDLRCQLKGIRRDTGETAFASFSLEEAHKAGLVKSGGGWAKFPSDMCFARALSRLGRQLFADVIGIGYVEGEISHVNETPPVVDEQPQLPEKTTDELKKEFDEVFEPVDLIKAAEYLHVVKDHFKWSVHQALEELIKDKERLREKFSQWKEKNG